MLFVGVYSGNKTKSGYEKTKMMKGDTIVIQVPRDNGPSSSIIGNPGDMETDDFGVEAELTSLSWLQSLDITSASSLPTPPCSPSPPPVVKRPPKKMSPLVKAELGNILSLFTLNH